MKKNILKIFIFIVIVFSFQNIVSAEDVIPNPEIPLDPEVIAPPILQAELIIPPIESTNIHLKIISGSNSFYDKDISVTACDSDDDPTTADTISAYCAILQSNVASTWNWAWKPGAFVDSIGGVAGFTSKDKDNNDVYHYWSWSVNGVDGSTGLNEYIPKIGDNISLEFIDPKEEVIIPIDSPVVNTIILPSSSGSSIGSSFVKIKKVFSVPDALKFLSKNQNKDGSFSSPMYTDWVAIAASSGDNSDLKLSLLNYYKLDKTIHLSITDYERRAMALMALGIDPYIGTDINYIDKIINSFDGTQFGDNSIINDDIFALIVLKNAGYVSDDDIIKKAAEYIISKQSLDGSWGSIDMTAAAIQSLSGLENINGVKEILIKGESYLVENQAADFSFNNSFSTSWVLQALFKNNIILKSENYLALKQADDGSVGGTVDDINTRIWSTSYAIPAILHKSWNEILKHFPKHKETVFINNNFKKEEVVISARELNTPRSKKFENDNPPQKKENVDTIQNKTRIDMKTSLISRIWHVAKEPFTMFLFSLGF